MALLIIILVILALVLLSVFFKLPKMGTVVMITGGVKTGKSLLAVHTVLRKYRWSLVRWHIKCFFSFLFRRDKPEKPLLYSNVPLGVPYVPLTEDLLTRRTRFAYKSVIYVCEASLVADSMSFRDMELNERLLLFNKLIGHETRGGMIVYDTQCINDNHYAVKRCLSNYLYIHSAIKWIPFFVLLRVKEYIYSDDKTTVNVETQDIEESMKLVVVPKSVYKKYDCYCYSILTDSLPVETVKTVPIKLKRPTLTRKYDLRAKRIVSFKKYFTIRGEKNEN